MTQMADKTARAMYVRGPHLYEPFAHMPQKGKTELIYGIKRFAGVGPRYILDPRMVDTDTMSGYEEWMQSIKQYKLWEKRHDAYEQQRKLERQLAKSKNAAKKTKLSRELTRLLSNHGVSAAKHLPDPGVPDTPDPRLDKQALQIRMPKLWTIAKASLDFETTLSILRDALPNKPSTPAGDLNALSTSAGVPLAEGGFGPWT